MALQAKLLRFLQERVIDRVGSVNAISVDVRVVCATHRDVRQLIESGISGKICTTESAKSLLMCPQSGNVRAMLWL